VISVAILTDIRLYRDGLAQVLDSQPGIKVVGTASNDSSGLKCVAETTPDVVLIDMAMPDSPAVVRALSVARSGVKVLALGVLETESRVLACAQLGIAGYVPRDGSLDDLLAALCNVARGEAVYSPRIVAVVLERLSAVSGLGQARSTFRLTAREIEIVELIDEGLTNKEIAKRLYIELATVKNHVHNILEKLQIRGRAEAAARLREQRGAAHVALGDGDRRD
jgi:two-component system nitrate/nitrite response regulator NarL